MARLNRDDIDKLHDYGLYVPKRTIYIGSENVDMDGGETGTDALMAERAVKNLLILDSQSQENITIVMNNLGGDWYHGMAIYDAIKACKSHITIKAYGYVMSMGSVIMQAADDRIMTPNARMMIHHGYQGMGSTHTKIFEAWADESKKVTQEMIDIYLEKIRQKHPDFTDKKLDKMLNFDTILTASEAIELGLADKILGEDDV